VSLARETIYAALFAKLQAIPGVVTTSRRLQHVNDVPAPQQPALYLAQTSQRADYATGRTVMWHLGAVIYLYVRDPAGSVPGQLFNTLLDGIANALAPDNAMTNACTLGGLAHWVRIGEIETDEGTLGEQAIARIPVEMWVVG
jgi:hypothetical protein